MSVLTPGHDFGRYRIDARLGAGGMGVVYVATDLRLGREVALKVITGALADDPAFRKRFQREARTLAALDSPHILTIVDAGEYDGTPYLATDLVRGGDLARRLARGPLLTEAACSVAAQLAEALAAAHTAGVIHRDVKPGNVLVHDPNRPLPYVYLSDFGIAYTEAEERPTQTGDVTGSWEYLAPERLAGGADSPASDVYGLGCLLWAMLTGRPPYLGSMLDVARGHETGVVPRLPADDPGTRALNEILARCLAKDPDDRYPDGEAVFAALTDGRVPAVELLPPRPPAPLPRRTAEPAPAAAAAPAASGSTSSVVVRGETGSTSGPPDSTPERDGRLAKLKARWRLVVAAAAVVVLIGGGLVWWLARDDGAGEEPSADLTAAEKKEQALRDAADQFPSGLTDIEITATSWSVEPGNLEETTRGPVPRDLHEEEREAATTWTAEGREDSLTYYIEVVHPPSDVPAGSGSCVVGRQRECARYTLADGRTAYEEWSYFRFGALHEVRVAANPSTGTPTIVIGERIGGGADVAGLDEFKDITKVPTETLLDMVADPALMFALPDPPPPLPSYDACVTLRPRPDDCPTGLN